MTLTCPGYSYTFNPDACKDCGGRCCNGDSGNIWVNRKEIEAIAFLLNMDIPAFIDIYLRKIGYKFSIKELKSKENYACVFYDESKDGCTIYDVRPEQCRTFPFWPYFKDKPKDAAEECPGVKVINE
jgi:Fe-S-cluster containining protein